MSHKESPRQGEFVPMPDPPAGALDELRTAANQIMAQTEQIPAVLRGQVMPVLTDIDDKIGSAVAERVTMWEDREQYRKHLHKAIHTIQTQQREIVLGRERVEALSARIKSIVGD